MDAAAARQAVVDRLGILWQRLRLQPAEYICEGVLLGTFTGADLSLIVSAITAVKDGEAPLNVVPSTHGLRAAALSQIIIRWVKRKNGSPLQLPKSVLLTEIENATNRAIAVANAARDLGS